MWFDLNNKVCVKCGLELHCCGIPVKYESLLRREPSEVCSKPQCVRRWLLLTNVWKRCKIGKFSCSAFKLQGLHIVTEPIFTRWLCHNFHMCFSKLNRQQISSVPIDYKLSFEFLKMSWINLYAPDEDKIFSTYSISGNHILLPIFWFNTIILHGYWIIPK